MFELPITIWKRIPLSSISLHPTYTADHAEALSTAPYCLTGSNLFDKSIIHSQLLINPVLLVPNDDPMEGISKYWCVSGFNTLSLYRESCRNPNDEISVQLIKNVTEEDVNTLIISNTAFQPFLYLIRPNWKLYNRLRSIPIKQKNRYAPGLSTSGKVAKRLGVARCTLYPPARRKKK